MGKILEVKNLKKTFYKGKKTYLAVNDVSFSVEGGTCVGIVGESGCGKSTTARIITRLTEPDSGSILLDNQEMVGAGRKRLKELYRNVQMVFQMPQDSFDPRRTLGDGIMEGMINQGMRRKQAKERMKALLSMVELDESFAGRYPHEVSGGQCQRAAIARALAVNPRLLICDEATSALDVTVQAQIIGLLQKLRKEMGLSVLMICHDLALVQNFCDYVLVMYEGKIVEQGTPDEVIWHPKQEYTRILVDSVL
ncbi:MAG: ABC transporter ATP-binding protein [Blautia sp.]